MPYSFNPLSGLGLDQSIPLDSAGKIPSGYLPSYVDDVEEYADLASFPATGETGKIYVAIDTGFTYRWSGSVYIQINSLTGTFAADSGTEGAPSVSIGTADNGLYAPGTDQVAISTSGTERVEFGTSEVVFNDGGENYDFRIEGDTNSSLFFVDASADAVGVGTTSPGTVLDVVGSGNPTLTLRGSDGAYTGIINIQAAGGGVSSINATGGGNALKLETNSVERARIDSSGKFIVKGVGTEAFSVDGGAPNNSLIVDSSGRCLVGTSSSVGVPAFLGNYTSPQETLLQVAGNTVTTASFSIRNYQDRNDSTATIALAKSKSGTTGSFDTNALSNNCQIGAIVFSGDDGDDKFVASAAIISEVDGTAGADDMPGRLVFSTTADGASSPTERMRISANGAIKATVDGGFTAYRPTATTTATLIAGYSNVTGTEVAQFIVRTNGDVESRTNSYGAISDIKLKENVSDAATQWNDIKSLTVRRFNLIGDSTAQIGLIAQEVELVSPGLVTETPDRDEDGNDLGTVTKGIKYSVLYMKAVKALQEAMERIEQLETEMAAVKAQLS